MMILKIKNYFNIFLNKNNLISFYLSKKVIQNCD